MASSKNKTEIKDLVHNLPKPTEREAIGPAQGGKFVTFYLTGEKLDAVKKWKYIADLNMLRKHSQVFAETFVTGQEWLGLEIQDYNSDDEFTTVLKIMRYIDVLELLRPSLKVYEVQPGSIHPQELASKGIAETEAMIPFDGTESYTRLFNLWLCGNRIQSTSVTRFLMLNIFGRPVRMRQALSTQVFKEYWNKTNDNEHESLRKMMVTVMLMSPPFEDDYAARSQILEELPFGVKDLMIHQMVEHRSTPINAYDDYVSSYELRQSIEE